MFKSLKICLAEKILGKDAEVLVYIGLATVQLNGQYYEAHVAAGDKVKAGDLMITFDIEKVKEAGYDVITPVLICNTPDYFSVEAIVGNTVAPGDEIMKIQK